MYFLRTIILVLMTNSICGAVTVHFLRAVISTCFPLQRIFLYKAKVNRIVAVNVKAAFGISCLFTAGLKGFMLIKCQWLLVDK